MSQQKITIDGSDAEVKLAKIVAQLVREQVTFEVRDHFDGYVINLTGGF